MEIKKILDEYVIGQEDAKKILSVAVHNHYKRIETRVASGRRGASKVQYHAASVPQGPEKPCSPRPWQVSSTFRSRLRTRRRLTEAGYVGEDVENIILNLLQSAELRYRADPERDRLH